MNLKSCWKRIQKTNWQNLNLEVFVAPAQKSLTVGRELEVKHVQAFRERSDTGYTDRHG